MLKSGCLIKPILNWSVFCKVHDSVPFRLIKLCMFFAYYINLRLHLTISPPLKTTI